MARAKTGTTYTQLGRYLMWYTRLRGNPDDKELAHICKAVEQLYQILRTTPMDEDEIYMWIQIHCVICDYLEMLDRDTQDMFLCNCYAMMGLQECEALAIQMESSRFGFKDELLKKKITTILVALGVHVNVLDHFFTEQVVCTMDGQNVMPYIERAGDYLKEMPKDDPDMAYILNQTLIAVQEAMYGLGISEGTPGWEDIAFIRDYVRGYLDSEYG